MNLKIINVLKIVFIVLSLGIALYCLYLDATQRPWLWGMKPNGLATVVIMVLAAMGWTLADAAGLTAGSNGNGREVRGAHAAPSPELSRAPFLKKWAKAPLIVLIVACSFFIRHNSFSSQPIWLDAYWPALLPAILGAMTLWWFYDTLFAHIDEGTINGPSAHIRRLKLATKRCAVLLLAFALVSLANHTGYLKLADFVTDPREKLLLIGIFALSASLVFINRSPAFDTRKSGNSYF